MVTSRKLSRTVLVVEDDPDARAFYKTALSGAGYTVVAVEDGLDALRHVEVYRPSAIVLDLILPRVPGQDVYEELRANPATSTIPVVIVTGADVPDLGAIAVRLLRKPVTGEALVAAVLGAVTGAAPAVEMPGGAT